MTPASLKPRLFVDVSTILRHDARTGIQRVVRAVWSELLDRQNHKFQVVPVFATEDRGYCEAPSGPSEQSGDLSPGQPVHAGEGDIFLGLDLSANLLFKHRAQLRAWRGHGASVHVVVYDVLPLIRPEWFSATTVTNFRRWFKVLALDVDQAICISSQVERDLQMQLRGSRYKSKVSYTRLPLGGDVAASRPTSGVSEDVEFVLRRMRSNPAILMVGTIEPRKGYAEALAAFDHMWRAGAEEVPDLVIVGKKGWKTSELQRCIRSHPEHGCRLHWLDAVTDEGLCKLYEESRGLLVTSHGEGFGLPLIEAVAHGRPVLARNLPVFKDQCLPYVQFFDDDRPQPLGRRLMEFSKGELPTGIEASKVPSWSDGVAILLAELAAASDRVIASRKAQEAR